MSAFSYLRKDVNKRQSFAGSKCFSCNNMESHAECDQTIMTCPVGDEVNENTIKKTRIVFD